MGVWNQRMVAVAPAPVESEQLFFRGSVPSAPHVVDSVGVVISNSWIAAYPATNGVVSTVRMDLVPMVGSEPHWRVKGPAVSGPVGVPRRVTTIVAVWVPRSHASVRLVLLGGAADAVLRPKSPSPDAETARRATMRFIGSSVCFGV